MSGETPKRRVRPGDMIPSQVGYAYPGQSQKKDDDDGPDSGEKTLKKIQGHIRSRELRDLEATDIKLSKLKLQQDVEEAETGILKAKVERKELAKKMDPQSGTPAAQSEQGQPQAQPQQPIKLSYADAKDLSTLPKEQQEFITTAIQTSNMSGDPRLAGIMPYLIMAGRQNTQSPPKEADYEKLINGMKDMFAYGIEIASPKEGGAGSLSDKLADKFLDVLEKQTGGAGSADWLTQMERLKTLGLIYTPKDFDEKVEKMRNVMATQGPIIDTHSSDLELARINTESTLKLEEIKSNKELKMAEIDIDRKRTDSMMKLGTDLATTVGAAMARGQVASLEEQGASNLSGSAAPRAGRQDIVEVECPQCHSRIPLLEPNTPRKVKCANCGASMDYDGNPNT